MPGVRPSSRRALVAAALLAACSPPPHQVGPCPECDAAPDAATAPDATAASDVAAPAEADVAPPAPATACPPGAEAPSERLWPEPGEVFYAQIGLGGFSLGEAAVLVGPTGRVALIDAGNDSHDDDVAAVVMALHAHLEQHSGFPPRPGPAVDDLIVTHYHADHGDGVEDLLEDLALTGSLVHRGPHHITPAANGGTLAKVCGAAAAFPGAELALCAPCVGAAPAACATRSGPVTLPLGGDAVVELLAVDGVLAGQAYEEVVGPMLQEDTNGENARSIVGLVQHGAFTLFFAGDLTGGGSDTDDVESFYAPRLPTAAPVLADGLGVDVFHAGHHGRDTSSVPGPFLDLLLPADGASRQVVMGISTAHLGSPHQVVLEALLGGERLGGGRGWTTRVTAGGAHSPALTDAQGGLIVVRTYDGGAGYFVQALDPDGQPLRTEAFHSVRRASCP